MKIRRNENVVLRNIHGCLFLINTKQNYLDDKCRLYEINEMGEFIWNNTMEEIDIDVLAQKICEVTNEEIEREIVINDIIEFIKLLEVEGFMEVDSGRDK